MMITASDFSGSIKAIPSDTINIPGPESKYNGVSTAVAALKLTDASSLQGGFVQVLDANGKITNQGVQIGDVVYNSSSTRSGIAYVTAIDSATSLTLSANIFPISINRDSYNIYSGNGVDLNAGQGFKIIEQNVFSTNAAVTTDNTAGYSPDLVSVIVQSGGTYAGPATFNVAFSPDGTVNLIRLIPTSAFESTNPIGLTIEFNQAAIRTASGVDQGTGNYIITITGELVEFITPSPDQRNAKPFQLYCGGTTANPPLACDIAVTTIDGDFVFFEGVQPGAILPVVVSKVNIGSAAAVTNGNNNTLTTATGRYVALN